MAYAEKRSKGEYPWRVRFQLPDGSWSSASGFRTKNDALKHGREQETDAQRGTYKDPGRGKIPFKDWAAKWIAAQDVSQTTLARYSTRLRIHILPRWGETPLESIRPLAVEEWATTLGGRLKPQTVATTRGLLTTILEDAVWEGLIDINPAHKRKNRGRYRRRAASAKVWVYEADALRIALNVRALRGQWAYVMVLLAAFTGMRWGELVGLEREYVWMDDGAVRVEWQLLEHDDGTFEKKEPKYESRRTLRIPPFLVALLREFLATLPDGQAHLFLTDKGEHPRRSAFNALTFSEAVNGRKAAYNGSVLRKPAVPPVPAAAGLTFHGLRHGHKVWIDEDGAPRVAAEERMGHLLPGVEGVYAHATPVMESAIVDALQARWERIGREHPDLAAEITPGDRLPLVSQKPTLRIVRSA